jgi:hypothetical protein
MRKLQPCKIKGIKNSKKQTTKRYKGQFPNILKNSFYVPLMLLKSKDDL